MPPPLHRRYQTVSIPASYGRLDDSPPPGTVVGIVLGSVAGFIFLLYLAYLGLGLNNKPDDVTMTATSMTGTESGVTRRSRRSRFSRRGDTVEVVEDRRPGGRDHVSVEESVLSGSAADGDVVEVFEEHSSVDGRPPPRSGARRTRGVSGSYRTVDPHEYGGESSYDGR